MNAIENAFEEKYNFSMKWIISREKIEEVQNGIYKKSDTFKAALPGVTFAIWIYPNGVGNASKDQVNAYLEVNHGMLEAVQCDFKFEIKSAEFTKIMENNFTKSSSTWGGKITSYEDFFNPQKKFFINDKVVIELEGQMQGSGFKMMVDKRLPILQLMAERDDMDVTVLVGDQKIKAHKDILAKISPVFNKMFKDATNEKNKIKIHEFSHEIVKIAIDFCYSKDIGDQITVSNKNQLLAFSDKFQIENLKNTVEAAFVQKICDETVANFSTLSITYHAEKLRECCICFLMLKKPAEILDIKNWDKIDKEICQEIIHRALTFVSTQCV
uniref:BTB domain-containing protein n=1 Tax=Panagrolaimus sp. ES5 TaxID=591445 RepID=A0AC34F2E2_9BILA